MRNAKAIRRNALAALTGVAVAAIGISCARADVYLGLQNFGGPIIQVASGASNASYSGSLGNPFEVNDLAVNNLTNHINEVSLDVRSSEKGTFFVWASSTNQVGLTGLISSFTENLLQPGWIVTMDSFLDLANGIFMTPIAIGSAIFNTIGTNVDVAPGATTEPYSVTTRIRIDTPRGDPGTNLSTIQISSPVSTIPEPSSLILILGALAGLLGIGIKARRANGALV